MATAGPRAGGTFANDTSIGSSAWTTTGNAISSNNSYTINTVGGSTNTNYLKATNFGFTIPTGATINGIIVNVERNYSLGQEGTSPEDNHVRMVKGGTISGDYKTGSAITTSDVVQPFGTSTNLWGLSWADTDINATTFGCVYSARDIGGASFRARCDFISITVYYTEASSTVKLRSLMGVGV